MTRRRRAALITLVVYVQQTQRRGVALSGLLLAERQAVPAAIISLVGVGYGEARTFVAAP